MPTLWRVVGSVEELSPADGGRLRSGALSSRPEWYSVYEGSFARAAHLVRCASTGEAERLIPLFHFERPPAFSTHDPQALLLGVLLEYPEAIPEAASTVRSLVPYPLSLSAPPFAFRYGGSLSLDALRAAGCLVVPVGLLWEFHPATNAPPTLAGWLEGFPSQKRRSLARELEELATRNTSSTIASPGSRCASRTTPSRTSSTPVSCPNETSPIFRRRITSRFVTRSTRNARSISVFVAMRSNGDEGSLRGSSLSP